VDKRYCYGGCSPPLGHYSNLTELLAYNYFDVGYLNDFKSWGVGMSVETNTGPVGATAAATEDGENEAQVISTEENILTLLRNAASLAEGNSRYAVEIAQRMSDQLGAAKNRVSELEVRVAELEAEVEFYREKSRRAEEWLNKISSEIQQRVTQSAN
jgi:hypothetical protein